MTSYAFLDNSRGKTGAEQKAHQQTKESKEEWEVLNKELTQVLTPAVERERVMRLVRSKDSAMDITTDREPPTPIASLHPVTATPYPVKVGEEKKAEEGPVVRKFLSRVELVFASKESKLAYMPYFKKQLGAAGITADHYKLTRKRVTRNQVVVVIRSETAVLEQIKALVKGYSNISGVIRHF